MKKKIAIVAGGDSREHSISINSSKVLEKVIDTNLFEAYLITMTKGKWECVLQDGAITEVDKNDFSLFFNEKKVHFDCVVNIIHGTPGEDGKLQGYFDVIGIPYTCCDVVTSAMTFNKSFCKCMVASLGVSTAPSLHYFKWENPDSDKIIQNLDLPLFIKPNAGGSSIGMSKVNHIDEIETALQKAFNEDNEVLVEEFIKGTEITCGLFKDRGKMVVLPLAEIVSKNEFFDYQAKYEDGMADEVIPARISEELAIECKRLSTLIYNKLNCKGVVRIDYILNGDEFYFLEINTIPGMSKNSIVPKMAEAFDLSMKDLLTILIQNALKV